MSFSGYSMMTMMMLTMFVCEKEVLWSLRAGDLDVECEEERCRRVCPVRAETRARLVLGFVYPVLAAALLLVRYPSWSENLWFWVSRGRSTPTD